MATRRGRRQRIVTGTHGISPLSAHGSAASARISQGVLDGGRPGTGRRWATSQATTSEICAPRQRPARPCSRASRACRDRSAPRSPSCAGTGRSTSERNDGSDDRAALGPAPAVGPVAASRRPRRRRPCRARPRRLPAEAAYAGSVGGLHRVGPAPRLDQSRGPARRSAASVSVPPALDREGGLGRAAHAVRDDLAEALARHQREIDGIVEGAGSAEPSRRRRGSPRSCRA